jgi:putative PIN family toxin of toxin-antitoxin system
MTPYVVFDCVVLLQGVGRPTGPARACIALLDQGDCTLCLSAGVLAEVTDVLNRPKVRRRFPRLTDERVANFLKDIQAQAIFFEEIPEAFVYARDPDDEPYVNLAIVAKASHLVTWDKDLLDLMNEGLPEGRDFRQRFPQLVILDPVAFLQELRQHKQPPVAEPGFLPEHQTN